MIGELSFFLGLQVSQTNEGIFISKIKYLKEMLNHFGMEWCPLVSTLMITRCNLRKDDKSPKFNLTLWKSMIESLLYMITWRADIIQEVGIVVRP